MIKASVQKATPPILFSGCTPLPSNRSRYRDLAYPHETGIFIPRTLATAWGGPDDASDNGETASGIRTDRPDAIAACSLPMPASAACVGTPIPQLPWGTPVMVFLGGLCVTLPLIDEGPGGEQSPCRLIDITTQGWSLLLSRQVHSEEVNHLGEFVAVYIPDVSAHLRDYKPSMARYMRPHHG